MMIDIRDKVHNLLPLTLASQSTLSSMSHVDRNAQVVDVPMIDNRQCEQWHREKGINVIIYDEMVCAGYFHGGKVATHQYDIVEMTR